MLSHLGGYLGASEAFLELCGSLGGLGVLLGLLWGILGASWGSLGGLGVLLRLFWALLGPSWGRLGALLGRLGALLGCLGAVLGTSWAVFEPRKPEKARKPKTLKVVAFHNENEFFLKNRSSKLRSIWDAILMPT